MLWLEAATFTLSLIVPVAVFLHWNFAVMSLYGYQSTLEWSALGFEPRLVLAGLIDAVAALLVALAGICAARHFFRTFVEHLFPARLSYFETMPMGRVLNLVSSDLATIDSVMPFTMRSMVNCILGLTSCMVVIAATVPLILMLVPPLAVLYFFIQVTPPTPCLAAGSLPLCRVSCPPFSSSLLSFLLTSVIILLQTYIIPLLLLLAFVQSLLFAGSPSDYS